MGYTTITLIEAELQSDAINASSTPSSDDVSTWIDEVDAQIELMTGEVFSSTISSSEYYDYDGDGTLLPINAPIISIDELRYNKNTLSFSSADWVTLEEGQGKNYIYYDKEGEIVFINGNGATNKILPKSGARRLCLTYTYGHNSVPKDIQRLATLMVSKRVISSLVNSQANTEGGEVTVGPITVKDPSNFSVSYIKDINTEIKDLTSNLGYDLKTYRSRRTY